MTTTAVLDIAREEDPYKLFEYFRQPYRDSTDRLRPVGFKSGNAMFAFPKPPADEGAWHFKFTFTDWEQHPFDLYVDLLKAELPPLLLRLQPNETKRPGEQVVQQVWEYIRASVFAERRIFLDPADDRVAENQLHERGGTNIPVKFSLDGGEPVESISGLVMRPRWESSNSMNWRFFVPRGRAWVILEEAQMLRGMREEVADNNRHGTTKERCDEIAADLETKLRNWVIHHTPT